MGNYPSCSHLPQSYQPSERVVITQFQAPCDATDVVAMREMTLEKNVGLKFSQVNVLKSVTKMTKRGDGIQIDQIGTQCLDELGMLLKD